MGRALGEREFRVLYVSDKQQRPIEFSLLLISCDLKVPLPDWTVRLEPAFHSGISGESSKFRD